VGKLLVTKQQQVTVEPCMWHVGKIIDINKRRTKQDNTTAEFDDAEEGKTWGHWCASADNYSADRQWVLLKPIPLDLDDMEVVAGAAACK